MIVLLLITRYMSLSTVLALWGCPILLGVLGYAPPVIAFAAASVLLVTLRHRENFKRLIHGTEAKFL